MPAWKCQELLCELFCSVVARYIILRDFLESLIYHFPLINKPYFIFYKLFTLELYICGILPTLLEVYDMF